MKYIDLTHRITEDMPVYPGTEKPKLLVANTYSVHGFLEKELKFYSHTGTHMDAPKHIFPEGISLDRMDLNCFIGKGLMIDVSDATAHQVIDISCIKKKQELADQADFLLFYTGWSRFWGQDAYFEGHPVISDEIAEYLLRSGKKGVGIDTISIDPMEDQDLSLHRKLLQGNQMVIIENLCNLQALGDGIFTFMAFPLKFDDADGSPVRAVAVLKA